jgi:hypothetical protein
MHHNTPVPRTSTPNGVCFSRDGVLDVVGQTRVPGDPAAQFSGEGGPDVVVAVVVPKGKMFPADYHGGVFAAEHGSWNRTRPIGARVVFTPVKADGTVGETKVFAGGWLTANGEYMGRPVDVAQLPDGSLLVSDDFAGAIYRISCGSK